MFNLLYNYIKVASNEMQCIFCRFRIKKVSPSRKRTVRPSEADNWENIIIGGQHAA